MGIIWECAALPRFESAVEPRSPKVVSYRLGTRLELLAREEFLAADPSVYGGPPRHIGVEGGSPLAMESRSFQVGSPIMNL